MAKDHEGTFEVNRLDCEVATYHSSNAKPEESWLGYCILPDGNQLLVRFSGATEQAVITKAKAFYAKEKARQNVIYNRPEGDNDEEPHTGRGAHFVGKCWMIHEVTRQKVRVLPAEVADYVAKGYVRGGPRSK